MIPGVAWVVDKLGGTIVGKLVDGGLKAYEAKLAAVNTADSKATEVAISALREDNEARRIEVDLIKAEQGSFVTRMIRPLFALPFIIFLWKIVVWDKVLGWGRTDPIDPNMWSVFMLVIGAYFGGRSAEKVASTISAVFKRGK